MNKIKMHYFYALTFAVFLLPVYVFADENISPSQKQIVAPNEIIVKYSDMLDLSDEGDAAIANAIAQDNDLKTSEKIKESNIAVLQITEGNDMGDVIAKIESDPRVEYAQPNYVYYPMFVPDDTRFADQWALNNSNDADIDAPEAWDISQGETSPPIVAMIDSGVMYLHPDLESNMWDGTTCVDENGAFLGGCAHGYNFADNNKDPMDVTSFHGTHVSGIIASVFNDGYGVAGIAPHAKIMALKFDLTTPGAFTTTQAIRGINFAQNNGAKIINASWGGSDMDLLLKNAIESFDGIFVTAAGNGGDDGIRDDNEIVPTYPCNYDSPNIICVAATDNNDGLASFSNYGSASVDVGAPGVSILSTYSDSNKTPLLASGSGTSMAVGYVSGLAALIWGNDPELESAQIKNIILNTGDLIPSLAGMTVTGRRINAVAALGGMGTLETNSFANTAVSFKNGDVSSGKTKKTRVVINFQNVLHPQAYMISRRSDFADTAWRTFNSSVSVSIKKTEKAQHFYVKFRDTNGFESPIYSKRVQYYEKKMRTIRNSKASIKKGSVMVQTGKNFSKNAEIAIFVNGVQQTIVKTNKQGSFSTSFIVAKPVGKYTWYAKDLKTGKKSKLLTYKVI